MVVNITETSSVLEPVIRLRAGSNHSLISSNVELGLRNMYSLKLNAFINLSMYNKKQSVQAFLLLIMEI